MKRAFISHVPENAALAAELCRGIEQAGLGCWIAPRDVAPGSEYAEAIVSGIAICPAFVLLLTAGSNQSMFVRHELEHATALGKRIFVVRAESVVLDSRLEPMLSTATEVDVWDPPSTELRWDRLADALAAMPDEVPVPGAAPSIARATARRGRSAKGLAWAAAAVVALAVGAWMAFGGSDGSGSARPDGNGAGQPTASTASGATAAGSTGTASTAGRAAEAGTIDAKPPGTGPSDTGAADSPTEASPAPDTPAAGTAAAVGTVAASNGLVGPGYDPAPPAAGTAGALAGTGPLLDGATAGAIDALMPPVPVPAAGRSGDAPGPNAATLVDAAPALPACPRSFALIPEQGEAFDCHCDESAMRDGLVWGTDHYAPESKLCRAALHAGVVAPEGGSVTVEWSGAQDLFVGTERNGVATGDERAMVRSARFRGAPPPPSGPGPCPTTFAMLPSTMDSFSCECSALAAPDKGSVWGSDVYQDNSALCLAAVHAGAITREGGPITVERVAGRDALQGSERHGVTSLDAKAPARSMRFR